MTHPLIRFPDDLLISTAVGATPSIAVDRHPTDGRCGLCSARRSALTTRAGVTSSTKT